MNRADHETAAAAFRAAMYAEAEKPFEERSLPDPWLSVPARLTCATPGCPVAAAGPVRHELYENADGVYRASCGACGRPITDITGIFDDGEYPLSA